MMTATFFSFLHDLRFIILLDLLANLAILHKSLPIKYVLTSDVCLTSSNIYRNAIYQIWLSLKKTRLWKRKKQIKTRHYSTRPERMSRRKYIEQEITDIIDKIHMFCHIHTYIHTYILRVHTSWKKISMLIMCMYRSYQKCKISVKINFIIQISW